MIDMTSDYVTVLTAAHPLNKIVKRKKGGKPYKDTAHPIGEAIAVTVHVPTKEALAELLRGVGQNKNQVVMMGFVPTTEPAAGEFESEPFKSLSAAQMGEILKVNPKTPEGRIDILGWHDDAKGVRSICARLKENVAASSWCLFDIDASDAMPDNLAKLDNVGRRECLAEIIPGFAEAEKVILPSTTGRVKVDGEPMEATGEHIYAKLADPDDLKRFGAVLLHRAYLAGYGFQKPSYSQANGEITGYTSWSIADPTTFIHGRLVYDGKPHVKGPGLTVGETEVITEGDSVIDSSAMMDLTPTEVAEYSALTGRKLSVERQYTNTMSAAGTVHRQLHSVYVTVDNTKLKLNTVVTTPTIGDITVLDFWKSGEGHTRCQVPSVIRESTSENGILNHHKDGSPFIYDNGTHIRHTLSDAEREAGEQIIYAEKLAAIYDLIIDAEEDKKDDNSTVIDAAPFVAAFADIKFLSAVDKGRAEKRAAKVLDCGVKEFRADITQAIKSSMDAQDNQVQPEGTTLVAMHKPLSVARNLIEEEFTTSKLTTLLRSMDDFYTFNGVCYQEMSEGGMRSKLYEFLEGCVIKDASGFIEVNPKSQSVSEVMDALKAEAHLDDELSPPCWIDGNNDNPPAEELLICKNGLLHMPTRELLPLNPGFFSTNALTYDYDAEAPEPVAFHKFLDDLFGDDPEGEDLLQEMFGYILSGASSLQKILMIIGPKRSGKGTIGRVLRDLVGEANTCGPRLESLGSRFGLQPLIGKKFAYMADVRLEGLAKQQTIAENILRISGEDDVNVERKNRTDWFGRLPSRFLMVSNMVPRIADPSGALSGRFAMLVLKNSFFDREDPDLTGKLLTELPGILLWALDGWARLQEQGAFTVPSSSAEAVASLERLTSPILAFLDDECVIGDGEEVPVDTLFIYYKSWCEHENRNYPGTKETFCRDVHAAVSRVRKVKKRKGNTRTNYYRGIGLKNTEDDFDDDIF